ncbi:transglutaminase [Bacillus sp. FJAT-27225]|uniref:transglutaminase TgpA family protein n=1 Tax=Bacillus sp. FJAT-27225 TaxID=1743144 RepID=UPI00080C2927|nr:transglutaminaseTgpA domain-containing protein [Bacillus sp. FJAT-27225]OCA88677.1 transglutaminase [Bacillus sp. FJAT-27225]
MNTNAPARDLTTMILYGLGFLLIWEWLRPVQELTDTEQIEVFLIFLLLSFAGPLFKLPGSMQFFIKIFYMCYAIYRFYFAGGFFKFEWWGQFFTDIKMNLGLIMSRDFQQLSNSFRTLMFFLLLWLMVYLIQYWLLNKRRIFVFFLMTVIYITVLDTFTNFKGDGAIVRIVAAGFLVMGILTYSRLLAEGKLGGGSSLARKWMVPLAVMIFFSTAVGYAAPKAEPIWPDPVPFLKSFNPDSGDGSGGVSRIGYGTNDSRLGGPFLPDDTIVFRAKAESRHYWKVESKDVYTGKGWVLSDSGADSHEFTQEEAVPLEGYPDTVKKEEEKADVFMYLKYPHIAYPATVKQIHTDPGVTYAMDPVSEKILSMDQGRPLLLDNFSFTYDIPAFKMEDLRQADSSDSKGLSPAFLERYTQLPDSLPERVRELAQSIAGKADNWYDQAKLIENYFDSNGFTYDQKDVAVPGKEQDYVDQFLFETKKGYCDNFSTSMTVMLRSIGIPARWVKGYTEGEIKTFDKQGRMFEITNNNAHSWVEVYLPNLGWIPLEPTKGFSNSIQIDRSTDANQPGTTPDSTPTPNQTNPNNQLDRLEENDPIAQQRSSVASPLEEARTFVENQWKWIAAGLLVIAAAALYIYNKRNKWLPYYLVYRFKFGNKDDQFSKAYLALLRQLGRYGLKRKEGQTLRNYAGYIDSFFSSREMGKLTAYYEQYLYKREIPEGTWEETKQLWENLIKKTIS